MSETNRQYVPEEIIRSIIEQAREEHSSVFVELWFEKLRLAAISDSMAIFLCESSYKRENLNGKYKELLKKYTSGAVGFDIDVEVFSEDSMKADAGGGELSDEGSGNEPYQTDLLSEAEDSGADKPYGSAFSAGIYPDEDRDGGEERTEKPQTLSHSKLNDSFTFENFIVGSSNKFAYAACYAVSNNPANEYNPLLIYGNSGLGKTHLLYAVTNRMLMNDPDIKIEYVKGEEFTNHMIESIRNNRNEEFRNLYRKCDVLLIDDIQFLGGKEGTQEEFFHTFDALYEDGKQIIMASDRPPKEIKTLSDRLRSRFEGGLIADIQPPSLELRVAILKDKSNKMGIHIPIDVLTVIATLLKDNVRQLEGAIKRISAQLMVNDNAPLTVEAAKTYISDMITGDPVENVTPETILEAVSKKYGVSVPDIKSRKRTQKIASARHIAVYIISKLTNMKSTQIGDYFGRDHSTILNSISCVEEELKINSIYEIEISNLITDITKHNHS